VTVVVLLCVPLLALESRALQKVKNCPAGKYSTWMITKGNPVGEVFCVPCAAGRYMPKGALEILHEGQSENCFACETGKYSSDDGTECKLRTSCAPGRYSEGSAKKVACKRCPPGSYQNEKGRRDCWTCEAGKFQDHFESISCKACPWGKFQPAAAQPSCVQHQLPKCGVGRYGAWVPSRESPVVCVPCPFGRYNSKEGAILAQPKPGQTHFLQDEIQQVCQVCRAGRYSNHVRTACDDRIECHPGEESHDGGKCAACAMGRHGLQLMGKDVCIACTPNHYQDKAGQTECLPCSPGLEAAAGQPHCTKPAVIEVTPAPTMSPVKASTLRAKLSQKVPEFVADAVADRNIFCPSGRYRSEVLSSVQGGTAAKPECIMCPAGQFAEAGSKKCSACQPGKYQNYRGVAKCYGCPLGKHQPLEGKRMCADIGTTCAAGEFSTSRKLGPNCQYCPYGKFQPSFLRMNPTCKFCGIGEFQSFEGQSQCCRCPGGKFQSRPGERSCHLCPAGYFGTTMASTCARCPVGQYQAMGAQPRCTLCPNGYHQVHTAAQKCDPNPQVCPAGYYMFTLKQPSKTSSWWEEDAGGDAHKADGGTKEWWKEDMGAPKDVIITTKQRYCQKCARGTWSKAPGLSGCYELPSFYPRNCPAGRYKVDVGKFHKGRCDACAAGTWRTEHVTSNYEHRLAMALQKAGAAGAESESAKALERGAMEGDVNALAMWEKAGNQPEVFTALRAEHTLYSCTKCSAGRFQPSDGARSCRNCLPGFFQMHEGRKSCERIKTKAPTAAPTHATAVPTATPTPPPSNAPSFVPTTAPTPQPTSMPTTARPTSYPSSAPTYKLPQCTPFEEQALSHLPGSVYMDTNGKDRSDEQVARHYMYCQLEYSDTHKRPGYAKGFGLDAAFTPAPTGTPTTAPTKYDPYASYLTPAERPPCNKFEEGVIAGFLQQQKEKKAVVTSTKAAIKQFKVGAKMLGCHLTNQQRRGMMQVVRAVNASVGSVLPSKCPPGEWLHRSLCRMCFPGRYQPADSQGSGWCAKCSLGLFSKFGATSCSPCPADTYGHMPNIYDEKKGTISLPDGIVYGCQLCPSGKHQPSKGSKSCMASPTPPTPSTAPTPVPTMPLQCRPGKYQGVAEGFKGATQTCLDCAPGRFQAIHNQGGCFECPCGYHAWGKGNKKCKPSVGMQSNTCKPGTFVKHYSWRTMSMRACVPCAAGHFQCSSGANKCNKCPTGKYQPKEGESRCLLHICPIGRFAAPTTAPTPAPTHDANMIVVGGVKDQVGRKNENQNSGDKRLACVLCPVGKHGHYPHADPWGNLQDRLWKNDTVTEPICVPCEVGRFNKQRGVAKCQYCPSGRFQPLPGQYSCRGPHTHLPEGRRKRGYITSNGRTVRRYDCPGGFEPKRLSTEAAKAAAIAEQAMGGRSTLNWATALHRVCAACRPGKHSAAVGNAACHQCPAGKAQRKVGQKACDRCMPGRFAPPQHKGGARHCAPCPPGKYQPASATEKCELCPAGRFNPFHGGTYLHNCQLCKPAPGSEVKFTVAVEKQASRPGQHTCAFSNGPDESESWCGPVPPIANADYIGSRDASHVEYHCRPGWEWEGPSKSHCEGSGLWTPPGHCTKECSHVRCRMEHKKIEADGDTVHLLRVHHDKKERRGRMHKCQFDGPSNSCNCRCWVPTLALERAQLNENLAD
jgi:hypothetical protein